MAYDLQEQDQLDAFKAFWAKYGNLLLTLLTVALLAVAGWRAWGWWQQRCCAARRPCGVQQWGVRLQRRPAA